jgi:hypothetical protein
MKLPSIPLSLSLVAFLATVSLAAADTFDSQDATIQKDGSSKAKIMVDKKTYVVPVTFADGADWTCVKDHYEIDPAVISSLDAKKASLAIGSDGTASFAKKK